ncbi:MAG TPA: hybrid sensor histidine kinase/response regulator, partial [Candidatus Wallbacteria bacterium]|nr:hybrid sensor histidine kinase/response regulator [Candidatus Wallbacteria bacterium]
ISVKFIVNTITCIEEIASFRPDLLLIDHENKDISCKQVISYIKNASISTPFIIMVSKGQENTALAMINSGAIGFIIKDRNFFKFLKFFLARSFKSIESHIQIELNKRNKEKNIEIDEIEKYLRNSLEKELNKIKNQFMSFASHEFKTPLSVILSSSELLRYYGYKLSPEQIIENYKRIENSVKQLTCFLENLSLISKLETGKLSYNPHTVNLLEFCRGIIESVKPFIKGDIEILFIYEQLNQCVPYAILDTNLLRPAIFNLINNAFKCMKSGGTIMLILKIIDEKAIFELRDNGIGFDKNQIKDLFTESNNYKNFENLTIEVIIAKKFIEAHYGKLSMQSKLGIGSIVTIEIPYIEVKNIIESKSTINSNQRQFL